MALRFVPRIDSNGTRTFLAVGGKWPDQRRYTITWRDPDFIAECHRHVPGRGFVFFWGSRATSLAAVIADCERCEAPPVPLRGARHP